ncbi:MAG: TIGR02147 family protein, partial [Proteobacteria bacterium]
SAEASKVVNDLFQAGLLTIDESGKWRRQANKTFFKLDTSSPSLQHFYRQMWEKAEQSLANEEYGERAFSATMLSVSESDFDFVKAEIETFRRGLITKIAARPGAAERIYSMAVQFFPLDRKRNTSS